MPNLITISGNDICKNCNHRREDHNKDGCNHGRWGHGAYPCLCSKFECSLDMKGETK